MADPNLGWDLEGRVYQTTLPFNAYWTNLHPDGAITSRTATTWGATGSRATAAATSSSPRTRRASNSVTSRTSSGIAVNDAPLSPFRDHVYAMWSVFNNNTTKIRIAVSRDRGMTFSKAVTITAPSQTGPSNTYIYPSVDAAGDLYVAFTSFPLNKNQTPSTIYVGRSTDDGRTFTPFVPAGRTWACCRPWTCRTRCFATGSSRTSRRARPIRAIST